MDWLVREARLDDAEAITDILNPIIEAGIYTVLDTPFTPEAEREYIANFPKRGVFYVAEDHQDQQLVGFQSVEPFATYTRAFAHVGTIGTFVELSRRRQGIGMCLSEVTFETIKPLGYQKLFTYVRADNPASLAFHLKLGFRIVGTAHRQAKFDQRYVDEIIIEKLL